MLSPVNCRFTNAFDWAAVVSQAWAAGEAGNYSGARYLYEQADDALPEWFSLAPKLCLRRHGCRTAGGQVVSIPPTEDQINSLYLEERFPQAESLRGLTRETPTNVDWDRALRQFAARFDMAESDTEHIFVMSTGRCGTVSLSKLFENTNLQPYHTYWFMPRMSDVLEYMHRLINDDWSDPTCLLRWLKCRVAEWSGPKPMVALNHTDTLFAPAFATLHPNAKFIHLYRDPKRVRRSFLTKDQFGASNIRPVHYTLEPEFRWKAALPEKESIDWYIRNLRSFALAVARQLPEERILTLGAEALFRQSYAECEKLRAFTNVNLDTDTIVSHFATRYNEKAHKATHSNRHA